MGSGTLYALGGLLQGAGQAITNDAEQRRQDALEALKRQYDVEDRDAKLTAAKDINTADNQTKLDAIRETGAENRSTEAVKGVVDQSNIILKGKIDLNNDTAIKALEHKYNISEDEVKGAIDLKNQLSLAGQTVDHWAVTTDGKMVAFDKKGGVLRYSANPNSFVPTGAGNSDSNDLPGLLNPDQAKAGGTPPAKGKAAAPAAASGGAKAAAKAQLGNIYAQISSDPAAAAQYRQKYPQMFDAQGNLLPKDDLLAAIDQRYGG